MEFQHDHEQMAALLDLMLATNKATDVRTRAQQAVDWLMKRDGITSSGIWLAQSSDLVCLARRNIDIDAVVPAIQVLLAAAAPTPATSVYRQDLRLTILPLGAVNNQPGALVVISQAPPDPGELLLLQAVTAHLSATLMWPAASVGQAISAADHDWEEFLAHAAHEIKNPLSSIKGYADLLMRRAAKDPADPYRKGLTTISQQVGRTTGLLDQLSDITRISAGPLSLDRHTADFAQIVDQVVQEYQAADQLHTITLDGAGMALPGRFDPARIAQVVSSVIGNALKFSLDGGAVSVLLQHSRAGDGHAVAQLAVSDTGVGVPESEQERIFERFFRGSNIRGTYAGLGVGLYIARTIVDLHGGRIWLESQPGLRTTCHVALPLAA